MARFLPSRLILAGLLLLAPAQLTRAQTVAVRPSGPATDVILRLDGQEIAGRVLAITPVELRYVAATKPTPDTLRLPVAEVFLVRYANGTREVLTKPAGAWESDLGDGRLNDLPGSERQRLGQTDATRHYRGTDVFWGAAAATLVLGPAYGAGSTAIIAGSKVKAHNLEAPQPMLLTDPDYNHGYQKETRRIKRRKAWAGYGTAVGAQAVVVLIILGSLFSSAQ